MERGETERQLKMSRLFLTVACQHGNALGLTVVSRVRIIMLMLACATAAGAGAALVSASAVPVQFATPLVMPRSSISMDQAMRMMEERYHARIMKTQTEQEEGRTLYVLHLLNDASKI